MRQFFLDHTALDDQHIAALHAVGFGLHLLHLEADSYFGALMDGVCVTNSAVLVIY